MLPGLLWLKRKMGERCCRYGDRGVGSGSGDSRAGWLLFLSFACSRVEAKISQPHGRCEVGPG